MTASRTHYEVLGIDRNATSQEVHRAHRELARLLHPDRLANVRLGDDDRRLADRRIREVNDAARVLGDPVRRARYDETLPDDPPADADWSPFPRPGDDQDPSRWERPSVARRASHVHVDRASDDPVMRAPLTFVVVGGILVLLGVLAIVLLVGSGTSHQPRTPGTIPGVCVRVESGPHAVRVDCRTPNDGRVVALVRDGRDCPAGAVVRRLDIDATDLACLEQVPKD